MDYTIKIYHENDAGSWNNFITRSANGTFLHHRDYMDYHAERFNDFSLMIYQGEKLKAVLPAHRENEVVYAHNGLTYSDFIFHYKLKLEHKINIIYHALKYLHENKITALHIKTIPFVFTRIIDQSNEYIYHQLQAKLQYVKPFFVYLNENEIKPNRNRNKNLKKIAEKNYQIVENINHLSEFWQLVIKNLKERYHSQPAHQLNEIQLLTQRFPDQIKLYTLWSGSNILSGALVYYINKAIHFQYIHSVTQKNERDAVEWLIFNILKKHEQQKYISFGTSAVKANNLNKGLVYWKQSFGSTLINQYHYEVPTHHFYLLKHILQ